MLRSVGKMCGKKSAEATVRYFEQQKLSHRLPEEMAEADGYQQDAAEGNLFLAYQGQVDWLGRARRGARDSLYHVGHLFRGHKHASRTADGAVGHG